MKKMKTAVVGCGAISDIYLKNMIYQFSNIEVDSCCAKHYENAVKKAKQYNIRARTYEEILADGTIGMVVILTPVPTHYDLIRRALTAGKHVYTEKTITICKEEADELIKLAEAKGLYLGSAPDTFLGASLQLASKVISEKRLGDITSFQICANRNLDFLASVFTFLRLPGGGICQDYGVYYLTALVSLLGPADRVVSSVSNRARIRKNICKESPEYGQDYEYPNESQVSAVIQLENGITGTFSLNGDSILQDQAVFALYGTKGILKLGDPNQFGGEIKLLSGNDDWDAEVKETVLENDLPYKENSRGIGPAEMVDAIFHNRRNLANKELAYHVLDIICQIKKSSETCRFEKVESTFSGGGTYAK